MRPYVSAVFWQDFGIGGEEHDRAVNWTLDHIFRPEFFGATERPVWRVMRQDDNGNHFEVARDLSHAAAQERLEQFEASGHKQFYWILPKTDDEQVT
jgi:hypothetical protein